MSLIINNLSVFLGQRKIIDSLNMEVQPGKVHAIMGPNGSGKSTLAQVLMGNQNYRANCTSLKLNGTDLTLMKTDERARAGLFLAFQNPLPIPGVNVANLLRTAYQSSTKGENTESVWKFNEQLLKKAKLLNIPQEFLRRSLNEAFSGGEKKKLEMLQAIALSPRYAIFDEIDTGLDIDALRIVAAGINTLKKAGSGILIITHYQRILRYLKPDYIHILISGRIVESGNYKLSHKIEKIGYNKWVSNKK